MLRVDLFRYAARLGGAPLCVVLWTAAPLLAQQPVDADSLPSGSASLQTARSAFAEGHAGAGADAYWEGCRAAAPETLASYWRDFAGVATPTEADAWATADSLPGTRRNDAACAVLRRGWARRAARTGQTVAERLALHYERLRYARERYSLDPEHMRLGPRTRLLSNQVGRPEEAELDDRGLVYVRLGPPDRTASFSGTQGPNRSLLAGSFQISPTCYHPNESWAYDYPQGSRVFHFSPLEGTANWWLLENITDIYNCGDPTVALDTLTGAVGVLSPAMGHRYAPISQIAWLVAPDLYMSRAGLDPAFGTLSQRIASSAPTEDAEMEGLRSLSTDALGLQGELAEERKGNFEVAEKTLSDIPDRPSVRAEAALLHEVLQFRAGAGGRTRVWLNGVVQGEPLAGDSIAGGFSYAIHATFSLVGEDGELRQREAAFTLRSPAELGEGAGVPIRLSIDVPPGAYDHTLVVRDLKDERERPVGNWRSDSLRVRNFAGNVVQLSDVAFAPDSGGAAILAPDVALPITPVHRTDPSGRAWLYFEAYGLSTDGDYQVEIRMVPEDDGDPFTLSYRGGAPASSGKAVRRLLRLELADSPPGRYTAIITVTDAADQRSLPHETELRVVH